MIRTRSTTSPEYRAHAVLWMSHRGRRVAGFSLIELLISVTLGLIVLAGLINLFVANNRSYQVQSANNFLQENVRIASDRISWSLRMADFWGGNEPGSVKIGTASAVVTAKGNCNGSWATAITGAGGGAIYGYDGAASFPFDATCIDGSANYVPGSDVLIVRYANPQMLSPGPPLQASRQQSRPRSVEIRRRFFCWRRRTAQHNFFQAMRCLRPSRSVAHFRVTHTLIKSTCITCVLAA